MRSEDLRTLLSELLSRGDDSFLEARREPVLVLRPTPFTPVPGESGRDLSSSVAVPLAAPLLTLGRDSGNDVIAPFASISRRHATIVVAQDQVLLIDRGSLNGTYVGAQRLLPDVPRLLRDGDEITFGHDLLGHFLSTRSLLAALRSLPVAA